MSESNDDTVDRMIAVADLQHRLRNPDLPDDERQRLKGVLKELKAQAENDAMQDRIDAAEERGDWMTSMALKFQRQRKRSANRSTAPNRIDPTALRERLGMLPEGAESDEGGET